MNSNSENAGFLMILLMGLVLLVTGHLKTPAIMALILWGVMIAIFPVVFAPLSILGFIATLFLYGSPFFAWVNSKFGSTGKGGKP